MKGSSGGRWRDRKSQRPPLDDGCHLEVWFWWGKALAENGMSGGGGRVWGVVRDRGRLDSTPNMVYSDLERMPNLRAAGIRYFLPALLCRGDLTVMGTRFRLTCKAKRSRASVAALFTESDRSLLVRTCTCADRARALSTTRCRDDNVRYGRAISVTLSRHAC